jgi:Na+-driven multidrug efflux pump
LIIGLWCLFSGKTRLRLTLNNFRIDPGVIWRIVTIGIPASVMTLQKNIGNLVLLRVIVPFGTIAVAAHSLMQRVELIMSAPSTGLGQGAGVLTGQNLGAHQPERAQRSGWLAASLAQGYILACSLAILLWTGSIVRLFTPDPGLVQTASTFLRIATVGYLVMGFEVVLQQCISGSGDTLPPMTVSLAALWLVQLPLAFFLPRITNLGVYGVRWGMVAGMVGGALAYITYFWLGRWKRKKV